MACPSSLEKERTIKLVLAFDGTAYAGWQRQKGQLSIQEVLEECLGRMTTEGVSLAGAGRTDAGVHALGMVASFRTGSTIPVEGFRKGLNSMLPADIRVLEGVEVAADFHARFSAVAKAYRYHLDFGPVQLPTERLYACHLRQTLDRSAMEKCLEMLGGRHDFSSFEATGSRDPHRQGGRGAVRRLFQASYRENMQGPSLKGVFDFVGDGFLRHMVRNLVGTLIEVGRGKVAVEEFAALMEARDRTAAGPTAPARGLFLRAVFYDIEDLREPGEIL